MINSFFPPYDDHQDGSYSTPPVNLTRIIALKLLSDWYPCEESNGERVVSVTCTQPDGSTEPTWTAVTNQGDVYRVADAKGTLNGEFLAMHDDGTYLPAGQIVIVHLPEESQDGHYELLAVGVLCSCETASEESGEEASSEEQEPSEELEASSEEGSEEPSGEEASSEEGSVECDPCFPVTGDPANWPVRDDASFALGIATTNCGCLTYCQIPISDCPVTTSINGGTA